VSVGSNWNPKGTSQAKVSNLENSFLINQEILWLQVTVKNPALVTEEHSSEQL
jgi:hypothetical protein